MTTDATHDIPHSGNAIQDDSAHDNGDGFDWTTVASDAQPDGANGGTPLDDFLRADEPEQQYDEPDGGILQSRPRTPKAKAYERKTKGLFSTAFKMTCAQPGTLADSAAILMHGPDISVKVGDLAAENAHIARAVDFLSDGSENAAAALLITALPFALQLLRNHEDALQPAARGFKVPFTRGKRVLRFRFGFKLPDRVRNVANPPDKLVAYVFNDPDIQLALKKHGITVAR